MFEINSKPKNITIQKKSKSGEWITLVHLEAHRRRFTYEEVSSILKTYISESDIEQSFRVVNEYKKTILSSQSLYFCDCLSASDLITVIYEDNVEVFTKGNNSKIKNIREFQKLIARNGGIKKWKFYIVDKSDNYLTCGKLILRNDMKITVGFH